MTNLHTCAEALHDLVNLYKYKPCEMSIFMLESKLKIYSIHLHIPDKFTFTCHISNIFTW
jgi:hypothetical protein